MTKYRAEANCPDCGRTPNVLFSGRQVRRCKRDRAAGHHTEVKCPRCGRFYWIRNIQIAKARPVDRNGKPKARTNGRRRIPPNFPAAGVLQREGIETLDDLEAVEDFGEIPGVGTKRAEKIRNALDRLNVAR